MFTISITEKGGKKRLIECTKSVITIGRTQGNDVVLPLGNVSKRHAQIQLANNTFTVMDIGSTNGTYVNGRKITGPTPLLPGDLLYVGEFIVSLAPHQQEEPSTPDIPVISAERPAIPSPVPKPRKSVPPPPKRTKAVAESPVKEDNEDTLTSIDESLLPEISSTFKIAPRKPLSIPPGNPGRQNFSLPISAPVEQLIDFVAIEERQIDRANLPHVTDPVMAARVRQILSQMIATLHLDEQSAGNSVRGAIFMEAFLSIVDIGPLSGLLSDGKILEIRINGRDKLQVVTKDGVEKLSQVYRSESQLINALQCLTAGVPGSFGTALPGGKFRLENGDLVVSQPSRVAQTPVAVIYKPLQGRMVQKEAMDIVSQMLAKNGNIAIGGSHLPSALLVTEAICGELANERLIAVEPGPLLTLNSENHMHFNLPLDSGDGVALERLLGETRHFQPGVVCARAGGWNDVPGILRFSACGIQLIANLPLGNRSDIPSLRAGLATSEWASNDAMSLFSEVFDILIICTADASSDLIDRIVRFEKTGDGVVQSHTLFQG